MNIIKKATLILGFIIALGGAVTVYIRAEGWIQGKAEEKIKDVAVQVTQEIADSLIVPLKQEIESMKAQKVVDDSTAAVRHRELMEAIQGVGREEQP